MKKLLLFIMNLFVSLWNYRARRKRMKLIDRSNRQLAMHHRKKIYEAKTLRKDIDKYLYKFFGINARSKYIPHDFKNKAEVKEAVNHNFGERMKALGFTYNDLWVS